MYGSEEKKMETVSNCGELWWSRLRVLHIADDDLLGEGVGAAGRIQNVIELKQ